MRKNISAFSVFLFLTACAGQPESNAHDVPGFFSGIWHGLVSPLALIGEIFLDIRIYAFPNSGGFYDLGFMLGALVSVFFFILALAADR